MKKSKIQILFTASEAAPFIKIGGLGDYIGSLPKSLLKQTRDKKSEPSADIRIMLPFNINIESYLYEKNDFIQFESGLNEQQNRFKAYICKKKNIVFYIIKNIDNEIDQKIIYSLDPVADGEKYISFSIACLDLAEKIEWIPDVIVTNDWHTSIINRICKVEKKGIYHKTICNLVVHNLPFMGEGTQPILKKYGIPPLKIPSAPEWSESLPLLYGLEYADNIIAVSESYAKEIQTKEFGNGLENLLVTKKDKITGILNGIDYSHWNPKKDEFIIQNYSRKTLNFRKLNKTFLQERIGFEIDPDIPLIVSVSRMDYQKGIELAVDALELVVEKNWQMVFLGTGNHTIEEKCIRFENRYPNKVRAIIRYDSTFARHMYAGGDIFLMPSIYEPCGLSQMIAMRYGCIPIAHAVGGLIDTINDKKNNRTGFLFYEFNEESLKQCLKKTLKIYEDCDSWREIQMRAMKKDFSWQKSASRYLALFTKDDLKD